MKIFSLKSRTGLVAWSIILGFIINVIVSALAYAFGYVERTPAFCLTCISPQTVSYFYGFPFQVWLDRFSSPGIWEYYFFFNLLFWIFVILVILSLIRYFKHKKV
ncbi:MAG: hypothetical protein P4L74_06145 [Candidatus Doudnabacteria bacterium]|nr:hypothetical protein [Candidatus Doudnabacteria bacterium]